MNLKEIQDIVRNVLHERPLYKYKLITFNSDGIGINDYSRSVVIPYKNWRVVGVGLGFFVNGVATENPEVEFGIFNSDVATTDNDYFGSVIQDTAAGKNFAVGDIYIKDPYGWAVTANALANGGSPTWDAGAGKLGIWFSKAGILKVTRPNDHVLTIDPFMMLEVKN